MYLIKRHGCESVDLVSVQNHRNSLRYYTIIPHFSRSLNTLSDFSSDHRKGNKRLKRRSSPAPGLNPVVIVVKNPLDTFHIALSLVGQEITADENTNRC